LPRCSTDLPERYQVAGKALLIPLYATIEHIAPYVALLRGSDSFEVIER